MTTQSHGRLVDALISEFTVVTMITLNAVALFVDAFPSVHDATHFFFWLDYFCIIYFVVEAVLKMAVLDHDEYWDSRWNRFDLFVVLTSIPCLFVPIFDVNHGFSAVLILRLGRLVRFFKLLRFVPDGDRVLAGTRRALKASIAIFVALALLNIVFGMTATLLFGHVVPDKFGNPLMSCYNLSKAFTIDGWMELPEAVAARSTSGTLTFVARFFFLCSVFLCGVLGLSLANAVFVDEMTADNTAQVERMVEILRRELEAFRVENHKSRSDANSRIQEELLRFKEENLSDRHSSNDRLQRELSSFRDQNTADRHSSNERLAAELERFRDENARDRREWNERITRALEDIKGAIGRDASK